MMRFPRGTSVLPLRRAAACLASLLVVSGCTCTPCSTRETSRLFSYEGVPADAVQGSPLIRSSDALDDARTIHAFALNPDHVLLRLVLPSDAHLWSVTSRVVGTAGRRVLWLEQRWRSPDGGQLELTIAVLSEREQYACINGVVHELPQERPLVIGPDLKRMSDAVTR